MAIDGLQIYGSPLEQIPPAGPAPVDIYGGMGMEEDLPEQVPSPIPQDTQGGIVSKEAARYLPPEGRCKNCVHFLSPGQCEVVAGGVDPEGSCSLFDMDHVQEPLGEQMPSPDMSEMEY